MFMNIRLQWIGCVLLAAMCVSVRASVPSPSGMKLHDWRRESVPHDIEQLRNAEARIRYNAAEMLAEVPEEAQVIIPKLTELALRDPDVRVRIVAVWALGQLGAECKDRALAQKTAGAITAILADPDPKLRAAAAEALAGFGPAAGGAVPALTRLLENDADPAVRRSAALALGQIGPGAASALPALRKALNASDVWLRASAARAIGGLGRAGLPAMPELIKLAEHNLDLCAESEKRPEPTPDPRNYGPFVYQSGDDEIAVGTGAVRGLAGFGPAAKDAVPVLIKAIAPHKSKNDYDLRRMEDFRREAVLALIAIGPDAAPAVPQLIPLLREKEGFGIEPGRVDLDHDMVFDNYLKHDATSMGELAGLALASIGEAAVPALIEYLKNPPPVQSPFDSEIPWSVFIALGRMGPRARPAVPFLIPCLRNRSTMYEAAESLGKIGPAAAAALPELRKQIEAVLQNSIPELAIRSLFLACARIETPERFMPELVALASDDHTTFVLRQGAIIAIGELGPVNRDAVPALMHVLRTASGLTSETLRQDAATALGRMGAAARPAVPLLYKLIEQRSKQEPPGGWDGWSGFRSYNSYERMIQALVAIAPNDPALAPFLRRLIIENGSVAAYDDVQIPPSTLSAFEALQKIDPDRSEFYQAVIAKGPPTARMIGLLAAALEDHEQEAWRTMALTALGIIAERSRQASAPGFGPAPEFGFYDAHKYVVVDLRPIAPALGKVMRDGTEEQKKSARNLMKTIGAPR